MKAFCFLLFGYSLVKRERVVTTFYNSSMRNLLRYNAKFLYNYDFGYCAFNALSFVKTSSVSNERLQEQIHGTISQDNVSVKPLQKGTGVIQKVYQIQIYCYHAKFLVQTKVFLKDKNYEMF